MSNEQLSLFAQLQTRGLENRRPPIRLVFNGCDVTARMPLTIAELERQRSASTHRAEG